VPENLGQIGANEFLPQPVSPQAKGTGLPACAGVINWGDAIKAQVAVGISVA
jgi:hypothetical protein